MGETAAFSVDDGGKEFGVDIVGGAGMGQEVVELGRRGLRVDGFGCRRGRVGNDLDAENSTSRDVDVVVAADAAAEEEADSVAFLRLVAGAVKLGTIAQGDVLAGAGEGRGQEQGRSGEDWGAPEGAENHQSQPTRGGWTVYDAVG